MKEIKEYLSSPPVLSKTEPKECLLVYLAVLKITESAVLVREDIVMQSQIYYISRTFIDAKMRYPHLEKLALALVIALRKLVSIFQCHPIPIVISFPLRSIPHKPEMSRRLAK